MQSFKQTLKTIGVFFLVLILVIAVPFCGYVCSETYLHQDYREREELAGTLDTIVLGASHAMRAIIPEVLDEEMGVSSYNLAFNLMTMQGRLELLRLEASRNPIKTVIMECSMDALTYNPDTEVLKGDQYTADRLGSFSRAVSYLSRSIRFWHYPWLLYRYVQMAGGTVEQFFKGEFRMRNVNQKKGYVPYYDETVVQKKTSLKRLKAVFQTESRRPNVWQGNLEYLQEIIDFCKEQNIELILVTLPISERSVAQYDNLNDTYSYYRQTAQENGIPFLDFNLHREKTKLLPDNKAFHDRSHLNNEGAKIFIRLFVEIIMKLRNGEDVTGLFYEDYPAMYAEQPYAH